MTITNAETPKAKEGMPPAICGREGENGTVIRGLFQKLLKNQLDISSFLHQGRD